MSPAFAVPSRAALVAAALLTAGAGPPRTTTGVRPVLAPHGLVPTRPTPVTSSPSATHSGSAPRALGRTGGLDDPPGVWFTPGGGSVAPGTHPVTVHWCDDGGLNAGSRQVKLDGTTVGVGYATGTYAGCAAYATSTVSVAVAAGQTRTLTASIRDNAFQTGSDATSFTGGAPPPTGLVATVVSPTPYRDPAACALDCGELVDTYATPAYVSRDVARGLTLVYRSGRARPLPVVEVDVQDFTPGVAPTWVELHLRDATGAVIPLTNGAQQVVRRYAPGEPNRLAAQFDAAARVANGAVGAIIADADTAVVIAFNEHAVPIRERRLPVRVPVDGFHGAASPYAAGWGIAGLQRFAWVAGGLAIADGDGTMGFWTVGATAGGVTQYTSPPGDVTAVAWDAAAGVLTRRAPDGTVARFGGSGAMLSVTDRLGNVTTYAYQDAAQTRLQTVTDPAGQVTTLSYFGLTMPTYGYRTGALGYIVDPGGRNTALWCVDSVTNDLRFTRDAASRWRVLVSDGGHLLTQRQDERGGVSNYHYDFAGSLSRVVAPAVEAGGAVRRLETNLVSVRAVALPMPGTGSWYNGGPGPALVSGAVRARVTGPDGLATAYALDGRGAPTRVEGPTGEVATTAYDALGRPTEVVTPGVGTARDTVRLVWNAAKPHLLDSTYDARARIGTASAYDAANFDALKQVRVNGVERQARTYSGGRLATARDGGPGQPVTTYGYAGRPASDPRPATVTDPRGHATTYTYQAGGLQNATGVTAEGNASQIVRDAYGRDSVTIDPLNRRTTTLYDLLNRPTAVVGPAGDTTRTAYDDAAGAVTVTDAVGQRYRTATNALGLPTADYDPANRVATTAYDAAGRPSHITNHRNQTVTFGYSPQTGELVRRATPDGHDATFGADPGGRWAADSTREARDTLYADVQGRDSVTARRFAALPGLRFTVTSRYDTLGRRTHRALAREGAGSSGRTFPGLQTSYGYTADGLLTQVAVGGDYVTFGYNDERGPTSMTMRNGVLLSNGLTALHTLGSQRYTVQANPSITTLDYHYGRVLGYDKLGRVDVRYGTNMMLARAFAFDAAGRLVGDTVKSASQSGCVGSPTPGVQGDAPTGYQCTAAFTPTGVPVAFAWDAVGNPVRPDVTVPPNTGNQLAWSGGVYHGYDEDGNLRQRYLPDVGNLQQLSWNALGQLTGVRSFAWPAAGWTHADSVTFGYDAAGRRARKTNVTQGRTAHYLWDGDELLAELDANGDLIAHYAHHPGGMDAPLMATAFAADGSRRTYYYLREAPGHVIGLLDEQGAEAVRYVDRPGYPAFGSGQAGPALHGGWRNPLQYGAREYDAETGLYYQRARYYDPTLGRFVSPDPIGLAGGINGYAYAGGDPVNYTDPTGLCAWVWRPYSVQVTIPAQGYVGPMTADGGRWEYSGCPWGTLPENRLANPPAPGALGPGAPNPLAGPFTPRLARPDKRPSEIARAVSQFGSCYADELGKVSARFPTAASLAVPAAIGGTVAGARAGHALGARRAVRVGLAAAVASAETGPGAVGAFAIGAGGTYLRHTVGGAALGGVSAGATTFIGLSGVKGLGGAAVDCAAPFRSLH